MRYIYFVFLFLVPHLCLSQNFLRGIVQDSLNQPIFAASVQITASASGKVVSYSSTDGKGKFELSFINPGVYFLEISHLSFQKEKRELQLKAGSNNDLKIILKESQTALGEVNIISQSAAARQSGDTISYNLKALTTGNEQKLKDVIKRLPGLEINDDGKITTNGKVINDLMVNGKKIFGDNHQMATENINAEMLEGIDLLNNYESFSAIKDIEGSDKTALNIKIKKAYLGKITGNGDVYAAHKERYKVHSNLFRFGVKANVTAIVDLNNTGEQALSLKDYISMSKSIKEDLRNNDVALSSIINLPSIPDFLVQNNNVKTKKSEFASFDFAYNATSKMSVNGFSIFNFTRSNERVLSTKSLFTLGQPISTKDSQLAVNHFFFNQTKANIDYKPNKNTLLNYSVIFDPSETERSRYTNTEMMADTFFNNEKNNRFNYTLGHQFSYIIRVANNKLLSFNAFQEFKQQDDDYGLSSNRQIYDRSVSSLFQEKNIDKDETGLFAKYTQRIKAHIFRLNAGFFSINNRFSVENALDNTFENRTKTNLDYTFLDASIMRKTGLFQYRLKAEIRNSIIRSGNEREDVFQFLPTAQLKMAFSQTHNLTFSYNRTLDFPKIEQVNEFSYASDFRNLVLPSQLRYSEIFNQNIFSANYFKFDLYSGTVLMANSSITRADQSITTNTNSNLDYNEIQNTISPKYNSWNSSISFEQRISSLDSKFKLNANHLYAENYNFINDLQNSTETNIFTIRSTINSNFKSPVFNYEAGLFYSYQKSVYSLFNSRNEIRRLSPLLNINGRINQKLRYYINNTYEIFKASGSSRDFYNLGIKLAYNKEGSKFKYWVEGVNILNMNNPEIIEISSSNNMFSVDVISRLSGFVGFGVSYQF
ncbi:carboxypeptidase regulatory-like domain-containing protein [Pedobacter sp. N23S346]|uniref:carboxypeptidase regulatory-like domain-containing protein n=1 Tax=Pedobacter sp. N23S346 TaxID=3402750 RepID=UPI003AD47F86